MNERGATPVVGVILMVAIVVILSATVAAFALDIGASTQQAPPQTTFDFDQKSVTWADGTSPPDTNRSTVVEISHNGGDSIDGEYLEITVNGHTAWDTRDPSLGTESNPGDGVAVETANVSDWNVGETLRVWLVYPADSGLEPGDRITIDQYGNIAETNPPYTDPQTLDTGDTVRIIWKDSNSRGSILAEYTVEK